MPERQAASASASVLSRRRWPALDGLRGSAVIAVLVCHYSALLPRTHPAIGVLEFGWAGVDLFFVLSGFLITGILLDAKSSSSPHYYRNFYARRALRIFPLYYGFLTVVLLVTLILTFTGAADAGSFHQLWSAQPALWTYTANHWISAQKTWSPWAEIIIPLWSLSVEEQFYLAWPLVVARCSPRGLMRVCVGVMIGALLTRLALTAVGVHWFTLYALTPTRADALAAGALLAALLRQPDGRRLARRLCNFAGPVAVILLIIVSPGFDPIHHPWQRVFLYTPLAVFFAALLFWSIDAGSLRGIPGRVYAHPALRTIGGYGYGVYVVHLPLMYVTSLAFTRLGLHDPNHPAWPSALTLVALNATLTAAVAYVSFQFFEKPILKLKRFFPQ